MKYNSHFILKFIGVFCSAVVLSICDVSGQSIDRRRAEIQNTLEDPDAVIPAYLFDSVAGKYQDGVSGTQVKEGKFTGTSLTIDDKSATVNLGFKYFNLEPLDIYSSFQIAGTASDKFVNIIKEGKYQQTITGGGVFNIFFRGFGGSADCYDKMVLHKRVDKLNRIYNLRGEDIPAIVTSRHVADSIVVTHQHYLDSMIGILLDYQGACKAYARNHHGEKGCHFSPADDRYDYPGLEDGGIKAIDTLKKLGVIAEEFDMDDELDQDLSGLRSSYLIRANYQKQLKFVRESEAIYMAAPWNYFTLKWFTLGASYNISPQPIIDTGLSGTEHYIYTYNSEYAKFSAAFNFMVVNFNHKIPWQLTISPTFTLSNQRNFSDENKLKFSKLTPYVLQPGDTMMKTEFSSEGFAKIEKRIYPWSIELPIAFLFTKSNIGIDFAARAGGDDPKGDNVGGRFGVYIPVEIKEGAPIWIEPVVRVGKLFNGGDENFWKDKIVFGFNLSIALKNYSLIGKK